MDGVHELFAPAIAATRDRLRRAYAGQQFDGDTRQALHAIEAAARTLDRSQIAEASARVKRANAGARTLSEDGVARCLDALTHALAWFSAAQNATREGEELLRRLAGEHGGSVATAAPAGEGAR